MHSVTSNAVAGALLHKADSYMIQGTDVTFAQLMSEQQSYGMYHIADEIANHISDYVNGQFFSITIGGPAYTGTIFKFADPCFTILFMGYANYDNIIFCTVIGNTKTVKQIY